MEGGELGRGPGIDCGELWALRDFPMCYLSWYRCKIGVTRHLQLRMLPFHGVRTVPNAADGLSEMSRLPARPSDSGFA